MKSGRKKFIWLALAAMLLTAGVVIWCSIRSVGPPQFVTLPDGTKYRFGGATWGTNQVPPFFAERLVMHLPAAISNWVEKKYGTRLGLVPAWRTDTPGLQVWMEQIASPPGGLFAGTPPRGLLADDHGVESGTSYSYVGGYYPWESASFSVVPRRSRMLEVHFYLNGNDARPIHPSVGSIRFRNPIYGRYPQWTPEPLPAARKAGDVEVILKDCRVGGQFGSGFGTSFDLELKQPETDERWAIQMIEASDATGNNVSTEVLYSAGHAEYSVPAAFWPDEKALRLKVWLKRTAGFASNELITITNLPLPKARATNGETVTNVVLGHTLLAWNFAKYRYNEGPLMGPYQISMVLADHPSNAVADWVKIASDSGQGFSSGGSRSSVNEQARFFSAYPPGTSRLNLTISVQQMCSVEFLVKPPK